MSGLNNVWDDFLSKTQGDEDFQVDHLPGLHMDDSKKVAETLSRSMLEASAHGNETPFPKIKFIHECENKWTNAFSTFGHTRIPVNTETVSPPVVLSPSVVHPETELHPRPDNQMEVDAPPPAGATVDRTPAPPPPPPHEPVPSPEPQHQVFLQENHLQLKIPSFFFQNTGDFGSNCLRSRTPMFKRRQRHSSITR